jgi:hypothetical protein
VTQITGAYLRKAVSDPEILTLILDLGIVSSDAISSAITPFGSYKPSKKSMDIMVRSSKLDLSVLTSGQLTSLWIDLKDYLSNYVNGSVLLSGFALEQIERMVCSQWRSYSVNHFEMLLKELIWKRRDYGYYLDWLIAKYNEPDTSLEVKDMIGRAAGDMAYSRVPVHDSDAFTAYNGFLLLVNSPDQDVRACLNTLEMEGASQAGIQMAGTLLGALVGESRVRE